MDIDLTTEPIGTGTKRTAGFPQGPVAREDEVKRYLTLAADPATYRELYHDIASSNPAWNALPGAGAPVYTWNTPPPTFRSRPSCNRWPDRTPAPERH
jgi:aconitase A